MDPIINIFLVQRISGGLFLRAEGGSADLRPRGSNLKLTPAVPQNESNTPVIRGGQGPGQQLNKGMEVSLRLYMFLP